MINGSARDVGDGSAPGAANGQGLSLHPVDELIRHVAQSRREVTPGEVEQIIDRVATAPFNPAVVKVVVKHRGLEYLGQRLTDRSDSLTYHLLQRVLIDAQWVVGTTVGEYLDDLRRAARASDAHTVVFRRRGGHLAATLTRTTDVLPEERRGVQSLPYLLVIFSADRGMIISGYQISDLEAVSIPEDAKWLK